MTGECLAPDGRPPAAPVVVQAHNGQRHEWDQFVRGTPGGTVFHLMAWRDVIEEAFGFRAHYLVARRGDEIVGVLPLFELRSVLRSAALLSLPFAVEGGVCAADAEARGALETAALALQAARHAASLELRDGLDGAGFHVREGLFYRFRRALAATDEENMAAIPRKQRRMIRVGQQSGLVSRVGSDHFDAFYDLYARSVRDLGTPVFPQRYFRLLLERFESACELLTIWHEDTPVAAVMSFYFNDTVLPYYAGSRRDYFRYAVNDFMYWELMRHARGRGARWFDFGRSKKGTGAYDFKCHWGFAPEALRYRIALRGNERVPDRSMSSDGVQLLRRAWQRLPLPITKVLGPFFIRQFGAYYT